MTVDQCISGRDVADWNPTLVLLLLPCL